MLEFKLRLKKDCVCEKFIFWLYDNEVIKENGVFWWFSIEGWVSEWRDSFFCVNRDCDLVLDCSNYCWC